MFKKYKLREKISISLMLSLVLHLFFAILYKVNKNNDSSSLLANSTAPTRKVVVTDFSKVKIISRKELQSIKKQIVATAQNGKKEKVLDSKFQGESDQKFDRQTIARNVGAYNDAGKGNAKEVTPDENRKELRKVVSAKKSDIKNLKLSDLGGVNLNLADPEVEEREFIKKHQLAGIENGSENSRGLASSSDYVEDIALGDVTNLNTTENKYYSFYHRIRKKLEESWGASIQDRAKKLYKAGRRLPASENLITAITVVIGEKGNILDIKIEGTSGVRELDQAAVESFNKAGPFPNPPKGLLVDGRAVIQWGFVVKS